MVVAAALWLKTWIDPMWFLVTYVGMSSCWIAVAAVALRKPRLIVLTPAILALDLVYRAMMLHAIVKTIREPRTETCKWDSPLRFELE